MRGLGQAPVLNNSIWVYIRTISYKTKQNKANANLSSKPCHEQQLRKWGKTFFLLIPLRPLAVERIVCHQAAPESQGLGPAAEATEGQYVYKSTVPEGTESPDRLGCPE